MISKLLSYLPTRGAVRLVVASGLFACMAVLANLGVTTAAEHKVRDFAFALTNKSASGQLHIVEMDAASIAAIDRWPWPRGHHANVVDQLQAAGVRSITFDVDFSTPSDPVEDQKLAAALDRADGLVTLPTFAQSASFGSSEAVDALPIEIFRDHATIASVSVLPDADGSVRQMPLGTITQGIPRPSLSAHIAGRSGSADVPFPVDFAIHPDTIPRHSFINIERGHFDPAMLSGKDIIIGATAIEMGDRYVVPRHGILPGVVVQALAAETLFVGVPDSSGWLAPLLLAAALMFWILSAQDKGAVFARLFIASGFMLVFAGLCWSQALITVEIVPAFMALIGAAVWQALALAHLEAQEKRLIDAQSGLANHNALEADSAHSDSNFTVVALIDEIDALKTVLGQDVFGQFISRLAERLEVAAGAHKIYRVDDRALAWVTDLEHYDLEDTLSGIKAIMRSPIEVGGRRVDVNLGFGIAAAGRAAEATHSASRALRNGQTWHYHQEAEQSALAEQLSLMGELDAAITKKELQVLFQPKLELAKGKITSAEALVRWQHPERGLLRPDSFIPLAEESDRIFDLTLYVLRQTLDNLNQWEKQGHKVKVAVNISARLVSSADFFNAALSLLKKSNVQPDRLIFEVTESATLNDSDTASAALKRFRDLGVAISMDDYGTGQSSLSYLKTLPLSELKIDRSFVQYAYRDNNDALLVRSTVDLAHQMGLTVVAEGVEDEECLQFLRSIQCDYAQGYHIAKPMDAEQFTSLLSDEKEVAAEAV